MVIDTIAAQYRPNKGFLIILDADDILLLSPSVSCLQQIFFECERQLILLDMSINAKKSNCLRIGRRCKCLCANIVTKDGAVLPWITELRYLGIYIIQAHVFKCSLNYAKRAFFRSVNSIFGKIGRTASEEVVLELIKKNVCQYFCLDLKLAVSL